MHRLMLLACMLPLLVASCGGQDHSRTPHAANNHAGNAMQSATPSLVSGVSENSPPGAADTPALPVAGPVNRSLVDLPDDIQGNQVHVIYAVPAEGVDRALDLNQTLANSIGSFNNWLATQTGGRELRFDTFQQTLDISFVQLLRTDADYEAFGQRKRDAIEADLNRMGLLNPDKIYAVYYEGGNGNTCADAPHPPALPGQVAVLYLRGAVPGFLPCDAQPFAASSAAAPAYPEFIMLHELLHTLGAVDERAPDAGPQGHTGLHPADLMYAGPLPWNPQVLDFNKSNYYNPAGLPGGVFNLAESAYLVP